MTNNQGQPDEMILFNDPSSSTVMTALSLALILLCCIISCFLNPTVFLHNRKKTSIAGLLFCIISATDFIICLIWPIIVLYYAATIDLNRMICFEHEYKSDPKQPQNCYAKATATYSATSIAVIILNCTVFMTTGVLAIVRAIQIKSPFCQIKKSWVLSVLISLIVIQVASGTFTILSPLSERRFHPAFFIAVAVNPYNLSGKADTVQKISNFVYLMPLGLVQVLAVIASAVTAVTLYRERKSGGSSNRTRSRTVGTIKVLLTNVFSLLYGLIFGTPIVLLLSHGSHGHEVAEKSGWMAFSVTVTFSVLSSVWNPIIFVCLTPNTQKRLRAFFALEKRTPVVEPRLEVTSE